MKSIGLDLASLIRVDFNLTTLRKDNVSRFYNPKATLVSFRIIIGRNLIKASRTKNYMFIITAVKKAI